MPSCACLTTFSRFEPRFERKALTWAYEGRLGIRIDARGQAEIRKRQRLTAVEGRSDSGASPSIDTPANLPVSADIKHPQFCRFCRLAPPSAWAGTR